MGVHRGIYAARFLLKGGSIALDFVDRILDGLRRAEIVADEERPTSDARTWLPRHLRGASLSVRTGRPAATPVITTRPRLELDAYVGTGPLLALPGLPRTAVRWRSSHLGSIPASPFPQRMPVPRAPVYEARLEFHSGDVHRFEIPGVDTTDLLLFDVVTGQHVWTPDRLRSRLVHVVHPNGARLEEQLDGEWKPLAPVGGELPSLGGEWSQHAVTTIRISESSTDIRWVSAGATGQPLRVRLVPPRVTVDDGHLIRWLATAAGEPVFSAYPAVRFAPLSDGRSTSWYWQISDGEQSDDGRVDAPATGLVHPLPLKHLHAGAAAMCELQVRGPLGSDLRARFAVIPGIVLNRPRRLMTPGERAVLLNADTGWEAPLLADATSDTPWYAVVDVPGVDSCSLRVDLPVARWAISERNGTPKGFGRSIAELSPDDLRRTDDGARLLHAVTGLPGCRMRAVLMDVEGQELAATPPVEVDDRLGSGVLRLEGLGLPQATGAVAHLALEVDGVREIVARMRQAIVLELRSVDARPSADGLRISLQWYEPVPLQGRRIRMLPPAGSGRAVFEMRVPDDARNSHAFTIPCTRLPSGTCRVRLVLADAEAPANGWTTLEFQAPTPADWRLAFGTPGSAAHRKLGLAMLGETPPSRVSSVEHAEIVGACLDALALPERADDVPNSRKELTRLATAFPLAMVRELVGSHILRDRPSVVRLSSAVLRMLLGNDDTRRSVIAHRAELHELLPDLWNGAPPLAAAIAGILRRSADDAADLARHVGVRQTNLFSANDEVPPDVAALPTLGEFAIGQVVLPERLEQARRSAVAQVKAVFGPKGYRGDIFGASGLPRGPILSLDQQAVALVECQLAIEQRNLDAERLIAVHWRALTQQAAPTRSGFKHFMHLVLLLGRYRVHPMTAPVLAPRVRALIDELSSVIPETLQMMLVFGVLDGNEARE